MNRFLHGFGDAFRPQLSSNLQGFFKTNLEVLGGKEGHEDRAQAVHEEGRIADIQVRANDALGNPLNVASGIFPSILTDQSVIPYHRRSNHVKKETFLPFLLHVYSILSLTA
jgi:hypothetical protein